MIGLMGLGNDERTLYAPNGGRLIALPKRPLLTRQFVGSRTPTTCTQRGRKL